MFTFFSKSVSGLLVTIIIANSFMFAALFQPKPAEAVFPVFDAPGFAKMVADHIWEAAKYVYEKAVDVKNAAYQYWDEFQSNHGIIAGIVKSLLLMTMQQALAKITNDTVAWINGGGKGKIRVLQDPGKFLRDAVDEAAGTLAGQILGVDPKSLCDADFFKYTLKAELTGPYAVPTFNEKVQCTFSGMADGLRKFKDDFTNGGWKSFIELTERQNNQAGQALIAIEELQNLKTDSKALAEGSITRNGGYFDQETCTITKIAPFADPQSSSYIQGSYPVAIGADMNIVRENGYSDYTESQFKTLWKANGGDVDCKITTPAQNIKALADKALAAPLASLDGWINGLTSGLGTDASSVLTPYLTAIGNAAMNQILKKEKGLITDFLSPQTKPRQNRRQPTNTLQQNAQISQSTTTLAGTAGDFRSFLLSAALEFSQFVTTTGKFIDADSILGYQSINRYNYNANGAQTGKTWDALSMRGQIGPGDQGSEPGTQYRSALCHAAPDDPSIPNVCSPSTTLAGGGTAYTILPNGTTSDTRNFFTLTAGRAFFEEAKWCGAYFQTLPTSTTPPKIVAMSPVANPIPFNNRPAGGCVDNTGAPGTTTTVYNNTTNSYVSVCAATITGYTLAYGDPIYACPTGQSVAAKGCSVSSTTTPGQTCPALITASVRTGIGGPRPITFCAPLPDVPIVLSTTTNTCPTAPIPTLTSDCSDLQWVQYKNGTNTVMATRLVGYDDDGSSTSTDTIINRVIRESIVGSLGNNGVPGPITGLTAPVNFTETIINTGRDENQNGFTDSILQSLLSGTPAELKALFEIRPNFVSGISTGGSLAQGLAQTATAYTGTQTYIFGGYGTFGFSNLVSNGSGTVLAGRMPEALAGSSAVYYPPNGRIYIFGGFGEKGLSDKIFEYNPSSGQFRTMSAHLVAPSFGFSASYYPKNQRIYLFGGINNGELSNQILEYNQTTDALSLKNTTLPAPLAHSAAATVTFGGQSFIEIAGGEYKPGVFSSDIYQYNPLSTEALALTQKSSKLSNTVAFPVMTIDPTNLARVKISGGQNRMGYSAKSWLFDASTDSISSPSNLPAPLSKAGGNGTTATFGGVSEWGAANAEGAKIFPEGDIYLIPGNFSSYPPLPPASSTMTPTQKTDYINDYTSSMAGTSGVRAVSTTETFYQKYQSPTLEGASALLLNHRQSVDYADPTGTVISPIVLRKINDNPNQTHLSPPFYPELYEKAQELMEKIRLINGYNRVTPNACGDWPNYYQAALADQLGSTPDDNPADNNPTKPSFWDSYDNTKNPPKLICEGYKGSVSDVLTRYNSISDIYQKLFAGLHDENALESVDKDFKILTPEETNIRLALIGSRCPVTPPSLTSSSADLVKKCPVLPTIDPLTGKPEYNMSRRFVFEPDDTTLNPKGITTGFATNPFGGEKSSALAGMLNLEEMTTQLQTLSPDKNIIKLIRIRQILEQLQVYETTTDAAGKVTQISPQPIPKPGKLGDVIYPAPLKGVDTVQVSLPGYEKIQDWLNATSTPDGTPARNQSIQELITSYGYSTTKEAYPQISQELDDILPTITNQINDKLKEVFLKRMELQMEEAQKNAQHRLEKFVTYARDMNPFVKFEAKGKEGAQLFTRFSNDTVRIGYDDYVLQIDATEVFRGGGKKINDFLERDPLTNKPTALTNDQREGIIGSAIYKIRTMAKFTGVDVNSDDFSNRLTHYTQQGGSTPAEVAADLDSRVKDALRDVAMYYQGIYNQTDPSISASERNLIPKPGEFGCANDEVSGYYCDLTTISGGITGGHTRIYKDVKTQLAALSENFDDMVNEMSKIRDEFQAIMTDAQTKKGDMDEMLKLFSAMQSDYDQANACFGLQNPEAARWKPSNEMVALFGTLSGVGLIVGGLALLKGGSVLGAIRSFFGWGGNDDEAKAAQARWQKSVDSCKNGVLNFNKHLGQVADQFLCGKINPIYQDK